MKVTKGCGQIGPNGYACTHHQNGEHIARGIERGSFAESWPIHPKDCLRHHVTGAIERGEAVAIVEEPAITTLGAVRLSSGHYAVRPYGHCGTCGWIGGKPWQVEYLTACQVAKRHIPIEVSP